MSVVVGDIPMLILGVSCLQAPCWAPTSPLPTTVPSAQIPQLASNLHTHKKICIVFPDKDHHIMNLEFSYSFEGVVLILDGGPCVIWNG